MKNYLSVLSLSILLTNNSFSQWTEIAEFNGVMADLAVFEDELFITGDITEADGESSYWSARYNGSSIIQQTTFIGGSGLNQMAVFNDQLYATGQLSHGGSTGVSLWTGSSWISGGSFTTSHSGIFADGDNLYVGSNFGEVSVKMGAGAFTPMPEMDDSNDDIYAINKYDGNIIIAGDLDTYEGTELNNIAMWDGTDWQPLGGGFSDDVRCLAVYEGELYAGGKFEFTDGMAVRGIAKWNGTEWSDVGGSVEGDFSEGVYDMVVHDGRLFVAGNFESIGGVSTRHSAYWDGTSWVSMDLTTSAPYAYCITVYNEKLYLGTFDFSETFLYGADIPLSVSEEKQDFELSLFPNPSTEMVTLTHANENQNLKWEVLNLDGQRIETGNFYNGQVSIDIENFASGIYTVAILDESNAQLATEKLVKN